MAETINTFTPTFNPAGRAPIARFQFPQGQFPPPLSLTQVYGRFTNRSSSHGSMSIKLYDNTNTVVATATVGGKDINTVGAQVEITLDVGVAGDAGSTDTHIKWNVDAASFSSFYVVLSFQGSIGDTQSMFEHIEASQGPGAFAINQATWSGNGKAEVVYTSTVVA